MMNKIKCYILGWPFPNKTQFNVSFLLLRFFVGLALCTVFEKVFPRNGVWGPQEWFVKDVSNMGFPMPYVFAWMAVLTEFIGGIFMMAGFMTRTSALTNAFLTFVAAFIYHQGDIVQSGLLAFFFMIMCLCIAINGPGKFSIDYLLHKNLYKNEN